MKHIILTLVAICLLASRVQAAEEWTLTTPESRPSLTKWTLQSMSWDYPSGHFSVKFVSNTNEIRTCAEVDPDAARTLMRALNKMDLRTNTLNMRALSRYGTGANPCLGAGTATGTPD